MKKLFSLLLMTACCSCMAWSVFAQETLLDNDPEAIAPAGNYFKMNPYPKYGVFLNGGFTMPYTDIKKPTNAGYIIGLDGQYKALYYLDLALDLQTGKLSAGETDANPANAKPRFDNQFLNAVVVARFSPLKLLKDIKYNSALYYFGNLYVGAGIGIVSSKVEANIFTAANYKYIGNYSGIDAVIPVEAGITLPVAQFRNQQQLKLNFNYRINFVMGDKLDGYITPSTVNFRNDVYNTFTVGVGYCF